MLTACGQLSLSRSERRVSTSRHAQHPLAERGRRPRRRGPGRERRAALHARATRYRPVRCEACGWPRASSPDRPPAGASAESDISHEDALQDRLRAAWRDQFVSRRTDLTRARSGPRLGQPGAPSGRAASLHPLATCAAALPLLVAQNAKSARTSSAATSGNSLPGACGSRSPTRARSFLCVPRRQFVATHVERPSRLATRHQNPPLSDNAACNELNGALGAISQVSISVRLSG
jgi:hypothetical protein